MGLPLPLATCMSWVGPPSNFGGGAPVQGFYEAFLKQISSD